MKKTRVMIVDDHSVVRMGLSSILNLEKDLVVCGAAESGAEAANEAQRIKPDVIVMDLMMPDMDGAEASFLSCKCKEEPSGSCKFNG